jgi:hypothetical protein
MTKVVDVYTGQLSRGNECLVFKDKRQGVGL